MPSSKPVAILDHKNSVRRPLGGEWSIDDINSYCKEELKLLESEYKIEFDTDSYTENETANWPD